MVMASFYIRLTSDVALPSAPRTGPSHSISKKLLKNDMLVGNSLTAATNGVRAEELRSFPKENHWTRQDGKGVRSGK